VKSSTHTSPLEILISKNKNQEVKVVISIKKNAKIDEPSRPKKRPKKLINKKEKRGKYKTNKYILIHVV
jgi:hypothetical protein